MKYPFALTGIFLTILVCMSMALLNRPSRQNHYSEDDINFLASDAHIVVGGVPLVVPFVALGGYVSEGPSFSLDRKGDRERARQRLEAFRKSASDISTAPAVDKLAIRAAGHTVWTISPIRSVSWPRLRPPAAANGPNRYAMILGLRSSNRCRTTSTHSIWWMIAISDPSKTTPPSAECASRISFWR